MANDFKRKAPRSDNLLRFVVVTREDFQLEKCVGKGGFGQVWQVSHENRTFAIKEMSKARIIHKRSIRAVNNERLILAHLEDQHIVNMHYAFQNQESLYLVMDYFGGGDLRYHLMN